MGKIKVKRKSTLIDMTAMSDVTVLLLTFFMLTSTFLQKEPIQVITPTSVSEEKVESSNVAQILIATDDARKNTKVFISLLGEADTLGHPDWASEPLRKTVAKRAINDYNSKLGEDSPNRIAQLSEPELEKFSKLNYFGVPMLSLHEFLALEPSKQDEWLGDMEKPNNGIPTQSFSIPGHGDLNEFEIWMTAIRDAGNENLTTAMRKDGNGIAIKADHNTYFSQVRDVLEILRNIKLNKFTVLTSLKTESD